MVALPLGTLLSSCSTGQKNAKTKKSANKQQTPNPNAELRWWLMRTILQTSNSNFKCYQMQHQTRLLLPNSNLLLPESSLSAFFASALRADCPAAVFLSDTTIDTTKRNTRGEKNGVEANTCFCFGVFRGVAVWLTPLMDARFSIASHEHHRSPNPSDWRMAQISFSSVFS